jgi:hypothetical protein
MTNDTAFEKHYSIADLVKLWGYSTSTVRRLVMQDPEVAKLPGPHGKITYRIPESVARRIHTRLLAPERRQLSLAR